MDNQKPRKTSNKVLIVVGIFSLFFIIAMIVTYWKFQSIPDTLVQYTLGAGGVEVLLLAGIKISKVLSGKEDEECSS